MIVCLGLVLLKYAWKWIFMSVLYLKSIPTLWNPEHMQDFGNKQNKDTNKLNMSFGLQMETQTFWLKVQTENMLFHLFHDRLVVVNTVYF